MKHGFAYIMTNKTGSTVYIGVTSNLVGRVGQHKRGEVEGFTKTYNLNRLVHYEEYPTMLEAIEREKQLKKWKREWKDRLINETNPEWKDLSDDWEES